MFWQSVQSTITSNKREFPFRLRFLSLSGLVSPRGFHPSVLLTFHALHLHPHRLVATWRANPGQVWPEHNSGRANVCGLKSVCNHSRQGRNLEECVILEFRLWEKAIETGGRDFGE